jgi:hypothetical protein
LIPDTPRRNVKELFESAITDQNGKFSINSIAPGDYKVFSWDSWKNRNGITPIGMTPSG